MKLYSKPGACSTADHIVLEWAGQPYATEIVDAQRLKSPEFLALNPAGQVPLIVLNDKNKFTLPLMIATVRDSTHADYGAQYVGMLVSIIPMVIVFCFASRIIMEKISIGAAVKG